jgi:phosphatidate cytidylyltransferase
MADDERPTAGDGFDDWLDEEPGPDSDPYAALADDEADEAEIADWMAFTEGDTDEQASDEQASDEQASDADDSRAPASPPEPDSVDDDGTGVTAVADADPEAGADVEFPDDGDGQADRADTSRAEEETAEIPVTASSEPPPPAPMAHEPATSVEFDDVDAGGRATTEEVPIITAFAPAPDVDADVDADHIEETAREEDLDAWSPEPESDTPEATGVDHDTGELPAVDDDTGELPAVDDDTGELDPVPGADDDVELALVAESTPAAPPVFDLEAADRDDQPFGLSEGDYFQTATRDHEGLAAAIAEAETKETEQVALAAPIPGLESTVVGFEDVVEAEGHTRVRARASGDLVARVITAVVLIAALGASLIWRPALVALATVVFIIGAGEFYTALRRAGRKPIALFGFLGILGASLGAFVWGAVAIPVSFFLVGTLLLLFYAVVPGKPEPMANLALTVTVMIWAGLGTYAMMIVESTDYRPLVVGVVLTVALMDIAQYFIGRTLGRHPLSPWVSPKKTIEGLVGGVIVALTLGALLHFIPPFELTSGLAIGAAVAVLSPMGDLAMSAAKRSLAIKDMGSILPGHGGFLDRIDGLLFVIPAAWAIFLWAGLL